jgi:hypothetical protein
VKQLERRVMYGVFLKLAVNFHVNRKDTIGSLDFGHGPALPCVLAANFCLSSSQTIIHQHQTGSKSMTF